MHKKFEHAASDAILKTLDKSLKSPVSDEEHISCLLIPEGGEANINAHHDATGDVKAVLELLKNNGNAPVYATVAPAFVGQFDDVTPGQLRSAFKKAGFEGMMEVALFADILTLKEALEFDRHVKKQGDYMLTSCCCPIWVAMIKKVYGDIVPHMTPSVSPMIASGRCIKRLNPKAKVVFIGPCIAKKAEAKEPDIIGDVDVVLTFREAAELFDMLNINPAAMEEDNRSHASYAGRIYARTGGVSRAVEATVNYLSPLREIPFKSVSADGVPDCKKLLADITEGRITANFIEGMGCKGGCVGGPKRLKDVAIGEEAVEDYAASANYKNPVNNPYVTQLLHRLGYDSIESLIEDETLFSRRW